MRITKAEAEANRKRALAAACDLFRERGFDAVAVAELMRAAGLTHGGFYNHFESKEAIEAEACRHAFAGSVERLSKIADLADDEARRRDFDAYRRRYVSPANRDAKAPLCPNIAFAGDMPRRPQAAQRAFAAGLADYLDVFARAAAPASRAEAIRGYCALFGALSLARAVAEADPDLADEILGAIAENIS